MKTKNLLIVIACFISGALFSQIIHVPADYNTIQEGINAASDGDTVLVAENTYYENIRFMGKAITVASEYVINGDTNHINNTIINGNQPSHPDSAATVMFVNGEDTTSILKGFTITEGSGVFITSPWPVKCGGGIFTYNSGAKIINNKIIYNEVEGEMAGASGIASINGEANHWIVIDNNCISNNNSEAYGYTAFGGGIAVTTNSIIKNNIIQYNSCNNQFQSADGGGIEVDITPGSPIHSYIFNNIIQFNEINGFDYTYGAGISINNSLVQATIINNIVQSNIINGTTNSWGAGICFRTGYGHVINNLILNNEANGSGNSYGGGIYLYPSTASEVVLSNNTISGNYAATSGGAIYSVSTSIMFTNSILWNNLPNEISGSFPVSYSNIMGGWSTGECNIDEDPLFVGSGDFPFSLMDASPCINSGNSDSTGLNLPVYDLAGNPRLYGGRIEMGAYENQTVYVGIMDDALGKSKFELRVFPNPFSHSTTIEYELTKPSTVQLTLYDYLGKQLEVIEKTQAQGKQQIIWNAEGLPDGVYFCVIKTNQGTQTTKLVKL